MRLNTLVVMLVAGLLVLGCLYVPPVWDVGKAIHKVAQIEEGNTTREEVLKLLGEPDYRDEDTAFIAYVGELSHGFLVLYGGLYGLINEDSWWIHISFDENDIVREVSTSIDRRTTAEQGDADAQYLLAHKYLKEGRYGDAWKWMCLSAGQGDHGAQYWFGISYAGRDIANVFPIEPDYVEAYKWYSLAASNGHSSARAFGNELSKEMTSAQIAKAERMVKEWKPDPAACEGERFPALSSVR